MEYFQQVSKTDKRNSVLQGAPPYSLLGTGVGSQLDRHDQLDAAYLDSLTNAGTEYKTLQTPAVLCALMV
jgi:hypothetical protein